MTYLIGSIISFAICATMLPWLIKFARNIDLLDDPDARKIHDVSTPSLGGFAIGIAVICGLLIALSFDEIVQYKFLLIGTFLIWMLGLRDDISSLKPIQKLILQSIIAFLAIEYGNVRLESLNGFIGVDQLGRETSFILSFFILIGVTNAFNLIDGIDGLAGSIGVLVFSIFGYSFYLSGQTALFITCLTVASALIGFLLYNWHPSKVFMGDTGSMVIGFLAASLFITLVNIDASSTVFSDSNYLFSFGIAALIVPIYDTSRVFTLRILTGRSPFSPDNNHVHHLLLRLGMNHAQATLTLAGFTVLVATLTVLFRDINTTGLIGIQLLFAISCGFIADRILHLRSKTISLRASSGSSSITVRKSA